MSCSWAYSGVKLSEDYDYSPWNKKMISSTFPDWCIWFLGPWKFLIAIDSVSSYKNSPTIDTDAFTCQVWGMGCMTTDQRQRQRGPPNCIIVVLHRLVNKVHLKPGFSTKGGSHAGCDVFSGAHPTVTTRRWLVFFSNHFTCFARSTVATTMTFHLFKARRFLYKPSPATRILHPGMCVCVRRYLLKKNLWLFWNPSNGLEFYPTRSHNEKIPRKTGREME